MNCFKLQNIAIATSILALLFLSSFVWAMAETPQEPEIVLPEGVLNAPQIKQLFTGKTVAATVENKDQEKVFYFGKNGKMRQVRDGWQRNGTWDVREDGRLCVDLKGSRRDCRMIVKQGNKFRQYAVKKDGNHRYEITYDTFYNGEQLAKISKKPILPKGTQKRKGIVKLFSGMTVESVTASKGRVSQTYYDPDGSLVQLRSGVERSGKWRVNKNDRMCLQMEGLEKKCRIIVKEDGEIRKYIVKKNSRHQHSVSYRNFLQGKRF